MTILSREGPIAPPPEDDDASARRASQPEPAAEPALEPAPYRPGKPEEHGHDGGEDQHLGGTHAAPLISPASCGTNRAGGAHNVLLARPNRRTFADYNEELRCGARVLLDRVLLAPRTLDRGWWRADALRQLVERHLAGRANDAPALGVILTLELFARAFLDAQEQERFGLDELDQVQLRAADGWLVCTENTAPAPVAVHETPADTLMPGIPEQGPE